MATQSRPFMNKGVALASAAAIAAATPAIAPPLDVPTHALATAEVQLATFADVMSVPPGIWSDILFGNTTWGGFLSEDDYGPEWAAPQDAFLQAGYVNPWVVYCGASDPNTCNSSGLSGAAYLFFDALINGDGTGFENNEDWPIGFVNYLFEPATVFLIGGGSSPSVQYVNAGLSAATWYVLQGTIGQAFPELTIPIASLFYGTLNVSVAYNLVGVLVAQALSVVPLIGPFLGNSILAYLGDLENPSTPGTPYQFGLSGTLNYWVDILSGAAPFPTPFPPAEAVPAAAVPAQAATAPASATSAALKSDIAEATVAAAPEASPVVEVAEASPAVEVEASPAVEVAPVEVAPVEVDPVGVADATPAVEVADAGPVVEAPESGVTSAADLPAVEVADNAAVKAPKRPVRSAVERAAKSVRSALGATKADNAGSNAVSPGSAAGSVGSEGSGSTAAESAGSDAGSASSAAGSASSDAGSADSEG